MYKSSELYVADLAKNKQGRNNLFVKEGNVFKNAITDEVDAGITDASAKKLHDKIELGLRAYRLNDMFLETEDLKKLQELLSAVSGENAMDYAYIFGKFLDYFYSVERE